ncbi:hypothetical protein FPV67DRAFT_1558000 [Lyophyllum atratum]|nr:hypothetical protein FPV67DRAFT_1558000 [Lyophyllum atratum]
MRLRRLPWALLTVLLVAPAHSSPQYPLTVFFSTTLIDALSTDPNYTSLLRLLQRARLVPTLNTLNGSTLFAPTNDAIKHYLKDNQIWRNVFHDDHFVLNDNVQEQLRQQLFYHLLNHTLLAPPANEETHTYNTLHYPRKVPLDPPSRNPPPSPPWMPIPGGTLGGEPQRLRMFGNDQTAWVGVDAFGKGGSKVINTTQAGNGVVFGISKVLEPPSDLAHLVSQQPSVSYFHKVLTPEITKVLTSTSELTLFLPVDDAWEALDPYERLYLESEYATDDLHRILNMHAVVEDGVRYSDSFGKATNMTTIDGTTLQIVASSDQTTVSTARLVQPDIYASNGVLHLVDSLLVPPGALQLTPEKYLLALNCTTFVSLLHSVNLTSLINDTESKYTILAPSDDVLSVFGNAELPEKGSDELKRLLQYHFIPGRWTPEKLNDGMLLETALQEEGLAGGRQVLSVEVGSDHKLADKSIRFAGAGTIGSEINITNTLVYFISRPLIPPVDPLQTALPFLELSSFLAAIFSTSQADILRHTPHISLLMPHNAAFKRLGMLVSAHLLGASSTQDLEKVLLHHALNTVEYAQSLKNGSQHTFATLEGSDLQFDRLKNGSLYVSPSGGWTGMQAEVYVQDRLTETGVIHELSDILIPRSVNLTIGKLVKAAQGSTMASIAVKAGFEWVLNGTAPPEGSEWAEGLGGAGWTLLCPTDTAFKDLNLTQLYADTDGLRSIIAQHLIPSPPSQREFFIYDNDALYNNRPLPFDESPTYSTLLSASSAYGDLAFRWRDNSETKGYIVGIKGARGTDGSADWARVLSWGRSTNAGGGGVVQIDRLLTPYNPPWWIAYGAPTGVGFGGCILICLFFYGVRIIWKRDTTEATYEPSEAATAEEARGTAVESAKSFIAGGFGGVAAVLVGHPFDLTKTRLQTAAPGVYTGAIDVVKKTLGRDGVTGLYRGMVPPLLGVTPIFAVSFWAYDASKKLIFAATPKRTSETLSTMELAAAGFLSAVPTTLLTAPVERAKVLLQVQGQGGSEKYKGVLDVMKHLYREGGLRSIFRGTGVTLARDGPGSAAYFAAYEVTKKALTPAGSSPSELNLGAIILAGGTAGVAMWALAIPPDVLKSRIQSAPTGTYSGMLDCARKTIAQDGVRALWRGFGPAMARFSTNQPCNQGREEEGRSPSTSNTLAFSFRVGQSSEQVSPTHSACVRRIARNLKHFETWSTHQCCEQVSYSDLPEDTRAGVHDVFDVTGRLPIAWIDKSSKEFNFLTQFSTPAFLGFIQDAYKLCPALFSDKVENQSPEIPELYAEVSIVFSAWRRLRWMRKSKEKWSEADYVANVYNVFRSPAIRDSVHRVHCTVSLPQPLLHANMGTLASRILNTKTAVPDCAILIPAAAIRSLSHSEKSPFKVLKGHVTVVESGNTSKGSSFRYQSTPCANLPETPGFEFASSFWEDKKPIHQLLEDAYRQNRMSTASSLRHLYSLSIKAPVFGLVWASGTVRAHVDWCKVEEGKPPTILSAPYPGVLESGDDIFHEWQLDQPSDILAVFFLIRNLDQWTNKGFRARVVEGISTLVDRVVNKGEGYHPWKRVGELVAPSLAHAPQKENNSISASSESMPSMSPKNKPKRRRRQLS